MKIREEVAYLTERYIKFSVEDIEGYGIDGGEKFGGTSVFFFPDEETMNRYKDRDAIGDRPVLFWKEVDGAIHVMKPDGTEVNDLSAYQHLGYITVLIVADIVSRGEDLVAPAKKLKEMGASSVYAYATHIEVAALDDANGTLQAGFEKRLIEELFTADLVFEETGGYITYIHPAYVSR